VDVDRARQDQQPGGVDDVGGVRSRQDIVDVGDRSSADQDVRAP